MWLYEITTNVRSVYFMTSESAFVAGYLLDVYAMILHDQAFTNRRSENE